MKSLLFLLTILFLGSCNINNSIELESNKRMQYTIEVSVDEILIELAGINLSDSRFQSVLQSAKIAKNNSSEDFISLFYKSWKEQNNDIGLASIFSTLQLKDIISSTSTDEEVLSVLNDKIDSNINETISTLGKRITFYGISDYSIKKLSSELLVINMPHISDSIRIKKTITGTAGLAFWETYDFSDSLIYNALINADEIPFITSSDSKNTISILQYLRPNFNQPDNGNWYPDNSPIMGNVMIKDTALINKMFKYAPIRNLFPSNMKLLWGAKPPFYMVNADGETIQGIELFIIKDEEIPLTNIMIEKASVEYSAQDKSEILITMTSNGTLMWKRMTSNNVGKSIAIVLNNKVFSAAKVMSEITNGKTQIKGNFNRYESSDFVNIINSSKNPIYTRIIKQELI